MYTNQIESICACCINIFMYICLFIHFGLGFKLMFLNTATVHIILSDIHSITFKQDYYILPQTQHKLDTKIV